MPPPASGLPARLVLGPALRAQSDRRLVRLVREGYESAFEEIVRRYRRPLDRFAASLVGGRSEDVTQDSFRKALVALRRGDTEVELRPWLYRIVRNTALNDLRDRPPAAAELVEDLVGGGRSAAVEAEERAEVAALTARLQALPERQRAALVMRELEGMSHEEIADALGISRGAARQAIARARTSVRSGFGALVPLPLLRVLAGGGADGAGEAAAGAAGGPGAAIGAAVGGGLSAGALKVGLATVVVAGSIGAGVAIDHHGGGTHNRPEATKAAAPAPGGPGADGTRPAPSLVIAEVDDHGSGSGDDDSGNDRHRSGDDRHGGGRDGGGNGVGDDRGLRGGPGPSGHDIPVADDHGGGSGRDDAGGGRGGGSRHCNSSNGSGSRHGGSGSGGDGPGRSGAGSGSTRDGSGPGSSGSSRGGSGSVSSGSSHGGSGSVSSGSSRGGRGSVSSGSSRGGRGSDDSPGQVVGAAPAEVTSGSSSDGSSSGGSTSTGGSGSSSGSSGGSESSSSGSGSSSGGSGGDDPASSAPSSSGSSGGSSGGSEISP
jgi:RNA polymerase sigma factor (sigma-70 family)